MTRPSLRNAIPALLTVLLLAPAVQAQRLARDRLKNGSTVRKAFAKLVAQSAGSTVKVLSGEKQIALGTIVDGKGYILTKASELTGKLICRLKDGRKLAAKVVGVMDDYDLAMLQIEAADLQPVVWREQSEPLPVGKLVATTDVSAEPLAVGVLSVQRRPIARSRAVLGVSIADDERGAKITRIFPGSGADNAKLKVGDVVTHINGIKIDSSTVLSENIRKHRPGAVIALQYFRGDKGYSAKATLGTPQTNTKSRGYIQNRMGGRLSTRATGFPSVFQHDTVLQPEHCGGPVVDLSGRVIGINIARAGRTETYALPATIVRPLLADLMSGKFAPKAAGPVGAPRP